MAGWLLHGRDEKVFGNIEYAPPLPLQSEAPRSRPCIGGTAVSLGRLYDRGVGPIVCLPPCLPRSSHVPNGAQGRDASRS